ncbi:Conidiation protein 6-domain-containing protein [Fomes fomentarius]|nr:Conidiation protein 6-domain-containing protein [Fomes fomentarius]
MTPDWPTSTEHVAAACMTYKSSSSWGQTHRPPSLLPSTYRRIKPTTSIMSATEEAHAQNVARGHKAAINNPNVSEEAKERSRRKLEEIEGTADTEDFVASTGSEKSDNYDPDGAIQNAH